LNLNNKASGERSLNRCQYDVNRISIERRSRSGRCGRSSVTSSVSRIAWSISSGSGYSRISVGIYDISFPAGGVWGTSFVEDPIPLKKNS